MARVVVELGELGNQVSGFDTRARYTKDLVSKTSSVFWGLGEIRPMNVRRVKLKTGAFAATTRINGLLGLGTELSLGAPTLGASRLRDDFVMVDGCCQPSCW